MSPASPSEQPRPAVFLDRDGTLIDEFGYLADPAGVVLFPGIAAALKRLGERDLPRILITNQSGVARELFSEKELAAVHAELQRQLAEGGASLDGIYYCPHHPDLGPPAYRKRCECRKPAPGMYLQAAREMKLDLGRSVALGDTERDLEAAQRAGIPARMLVLTGKGQATYDGWQAQGTAHPATHIFADLGAALETIEQLTQGQA